MFDDGIPTDDSFTELTSLPVPVSARTSMRRSRATRALSFDDAFPRTDRLSHTAQTTHDEHLETSCEGVTACRNHVATPSVISGFIEEDEQRADLIGDMTTQHVLPLETNSQHADLKSISLHTVSYNII